MCCEYEMQAAAENIFQRKIDSGVPYRSSTINVNKENGIFQKGHWEDISNTILRFMLMNVFVCVCVNNEQQQPCTYVKQVNLFFSSLSFAF